MKDKTMTHFCKKYGWKSYAISESNKGGDDEKQIGRLAQYTHTLAWNNVEDACSIREEWKKLRLEGEGNKINQIFSLKDIKLLVFRMPPPRSNTHGKFYVFEINYYQWRGVNSMTL